VGELTKSAGDQIIISPTAI